jgi:hypothetical protein
MPPRFASRRRQPPPPRLSPLMPASHASFCFAIRQIFSPLVAFFAADIDYCRHYIILIHYYFFHFIDYY